MSHAVVLMQFKGHRHDSIQACGCEQQVKGKLQVPEGSRGVGQGGLPEGPCPVPAPAADNLQYVTFACDIALCICLLQGQTYLRHAQ